MKYILVLLVVFVFSGCTTVVPPVTEYRVVAKKVDFNTNSKGCEEKILKVTQAFSSSTLMSQQMNYAQGKSKQYSYSQAQWSEPPNISVSAQILKQIRKSNIFKSVLNSKSRGKGDLVLEINIEDFMQYFNEDESKSYAVVTLDFTLVDAKSADTLASDTFSAKVDTVTLDAQGGVEALNEALEKVTKSSLKWLDGVCR